MKKLVYFVALAAFVAGNPLFAQQNDEPAVAPVVNRGKGGFVAPPRVHRVRDVKGLPDDTKVVFTGFISEQVGEDKYMFNGVSMNEQGGIVSWTRDDNDTIVVEIDDDKWQGQTVTPKDFVRIEGEVDKDDDGVKVDVKAIIKMDRNPVIDIDMQRSVRTNRSVDGKAAGARGVSQMQAMVDALDLPDGTAVTLEGYVMRHLRGDKYLFTDTDRRLRVQVEIDDDVWRRQRLIGADDRVIIHGKVDRERGSSVEIDVKEIRKVGVPHSMLKSGGAEGDAGAEIRTGRRDGGWRSVKGSVLVGRSAR